MAKAATPPKRMLEKSELVEKIGKAILEKVTIKVGEPVTGTAEARLIAQLFQVERVDPNALATLPTESRRRVRFVRVRSRRATRAAWPDLHAIRRIAPAPFRHHCRPSHAGRDVRLGDRAGERS